MPALVLALFFALAPVFGLAAEQATTSTSTVSTAPVPVTSIIGTETRSQADIDLSIETPQQVSDEESLLSLLRFISYHDERVERIDTKQKGFVFEYKHGAKLFGFIQISMTEEIRVDADGSGRLDVDVDRPWWAPFSKSPASARDVISRIKARTSNVSFRDLKGAWTLPVMAQMVFESHIATEIAYTEG